MINIIKNMKKTPRQEIKELETLKTGHYCFYNTRIEQIKTEFWNKSVKLLETINVGIIYSKVAHDDVYNMLLDGIAVKTIKNKYRAG